MEISFKTNFLWFFPQMACPAFQNLYLKVQKDYSYFHTSVRESLHIFLLKRTHTPLLTRIHLSFSFLLYFLMYHSYEFSSPSFTLSLSLMHTHWFGHMPTVIHITWEDAQNTMARAVSDRVGRVEVGVGWGEEGSPRSGNRGHRWETWGSG